ncbi:hypothetical protein [Sphingomonas immobilis]|uniref:Secreted protein n=1 Tax=Sphingomonas immobilis TaxID=3063997 RepID=A0ABT8ZYX3_9SPHN|nr:hypothetical protein [Sphingomonas sp. CA1-15]MDO7842783.1 hypothetical protein [Sphingomonas sp. CA1-15]
MMLLMALSLAAAGDAGLTKHVADLRCGAADLRVTSHALAGTTAPVAQSLTRRVGKKRVAVALEPAGSALVDGHRVRGRYVVSWACLTGAQRVRYVMLGYNCAVDPGDPHDCGGEKEWFRLLDTRGRFVDAGVPHDGDRRDRLYARLGIADQTAAGVKMAGVLD